jgi:hypothetical protein
MTKNILVIAFLCLTLPLASGARADMNPPAGPIQDRAPGFPWPAFQRFWNTRCEPGVALEKPLSRANQYIVQYGQSVNLLVQMKSDTVHTVTALYADPRTYPGGGKVWLKLISTLITIGSYRWPEERIEEVRGRFGVVSERPAEYVWQNIVFRRSFDSGSGWAFSLEFQSPS